MTKQFSIENIETKLGKDAKSFSKEDREKASREAMTEKEKLEKENIAITREINFLKNGATNGELFKGEELNDLAEKVFLGQDLNDEEKRIISTHANIINPIVKKKEHRRNIDKALNSKTIGGLEDIVLETKPQSKKTGSVRGLEGYVPDIAKDTLEQKVEHNDFSQENVDSILEKIKDGKNLTAEEEALRRTFPLIFSNTDTPYEIPNAKPKTEGKRSWFSGVKNWFNNAFSSTPEEKAEFQKRMRETLSVTDMGVEYGVERQKLNESENTAVQTKKETKAEMEARLKQEFAERVQKEIDAKMIGEWAGASEQERLEKTYNFYLQERSAFEKERAGKFRKILDKVDTWWKGLDDKKYGSNFKTAVSAGMVGMGVIGGGLLTGRIDASLGSIGYRLASKVGLATAMNAALTFNKNKGANTGNLELKENLTDKEKEFLLNKKAKGWVYALIGAGVSGVIAASGAVVAIGAGGYAVKKAIEKYMINKEKEINKNKNENKALLKSEDFKDGYDRDKMMQNFAMFGDAYAKLDRQAKNLSWYKSITNVTTSTATGLATLLAASPQVDHSKETSHAKDITEKQAKTDTPVSKTPNQTQINVPKPPIANSPDHNTSTGTPPEGTPPVTPETKTDHVEFLKVDKGDGMTQTLKRLVDGGKAPKWVMEELGKNPTAKNYADFAEKFGMLHPKDAADSIKISAGDSFGFDDKGDFIWKHDNENYTVVKIDTHGHSEEGDWADKMQDEKFIHSEKHINHTESPHTDSGEAPEKVTDASDAPGPTNADGSENIDPNKMVPPEKVTDAPVEHPAGAGDTKPESKEPEVITVEKLVIDPNPYNLGPAQLEYINSVYENGFLDHVFKNEDSLKWWNEISHTKTATDFLNLDPKTITDGAQEKLMRVMQSVHKITGLEPYHSTVLQPEIPNETIKQYIIRGLQHAYIKGNNLNDINIEGRPITI